MSTLAEVFEKQILPKNSVLTTINKDLNAAITLFYTLDGTLAREQASSWNVPQLPLAPRSF